MGTPRLNETAGVSAADWHSERKQEVPIYKNTTALISNYPPAQKLWSYVHTGVMVCCTAMWEYFVNTY